MPNVFVNSLVEYIMHRYGSCQDYWCWIKDQIESNIPVYLYSRNTLPNIAHMALCLKVVICIIMHLYYYVEKSYLNLNVAVLHTWPYCHWTINKNISFRYTNIKYQSRPALCIASCRLHSGLSRGIWDLNYFLVNAFFKSHIVDYLCETEDK